MQETECSVKIGISKRCHLPQRMLVTVYLYVYLYVRVYVCLLSCNAYVCVCVIGCPSTWVPASLLFLTLIGSLSSFPVPERKGGLFLCGAAFARTTCAPSPWVSLKRCSGVAEEDVERVYSSRIPVVSFFLSLLFF